MSLPLITFSAFELEQKLSNFVLSSLSVFLNSKTCVVTNLNPLNSADNFLSLFLITDLVSYSYNSGLKRNFNIISVCKTFKSMICFCYFYVFFGSKILNFFCITM